MRKFFLFFLFYSTFSIGMIASVPNDKTGAVQKKVTSNSADKTLNSKQTETSSPVSDTKNSSFQKKDTQKQQKKLDPAEKFKKLGTNNVGLDTKKITFDFPDTNIKVFARFVAELCEKILIGEDLLKGNVNIKSQRNMDLSEVKELFNAILSTKGLEYVETEECMDIIQIADSYVKVYNLQYLKADDLAKALSQMFKMSFRVGNNPVNIQISSVTGSNAIMVLAPKNQQIEIEESIKELDVEVRQVLLEVLVIEITKNDDFGYGSNVTYKQGAPSNAIIGGTGLATSTVGYSFDDGMWNVDIKANENETQLRVLSQPRVIAIENQKSEIKVMKKQPYANGSTSQQTGGTSGSVATTTTTTTEDVGLDLSITPRINKEKDVTLELSLDITSIVGSSNMAIGIDKLGNAVTQVVPIIGHRIITNTSVVNTGKTLVIGGLLDNSKTTISTGPPVLGDIPWVGWMVNTTTETVEQTELMIYITPIVISNSEELRSLTKKELKKIRNYSSEDKDTVDQMLTGEGAENEHTFNLFKYFSKEEYREKQDFIPQVKNL